MATSEDGHKETEESKQDKDIRDEEGGREKMESHNCLNFALLMFLPELACLHGVKPLASNIILSCHMLASMLRMRHGTPAYCACLIAFLPVAFAKRS